MDEKHKPEYEIGWRENLRLSWQGRADGKHQRFSEITSCLTNETGHISPKMVEEA